MSEQTFGSTLMGLERNRVLVVLPEPGQHGSAERQSGQGNQFAKPLSVTESGVFELEASGIRSAQALERLYLIAAVATLYGTT